MMMSTFMTSISTRLREFKRDETGTTLVELAICISLFLLILFAIIDFSRLGYNWVVAEKAMQRGVRIAAVRPPVCSGLPAVHFASSANIGSYSAGTLCLTDGGICAPAFAQCLLSAPASGDAFATATEIWNALEPLMPQGTTRANIQMSYNYDPRLGFLGGPYVPIITARIVGAANADSETGYDELPFQFVTPLSALAAQAGASDVTGIPGSIPFPGIEVTLPAEDMNQGMQG
jgi:Flp pilus assembly protein TadG